MLFAKHPLPQFQNAPRKGFRLGEVPSCFVKERQVVQA